MARLNGPCLGCKDRVADPPCHATCKKYIAFREAKDQENEETYIQKKYVMDANGIEADRIRAVKDGKMYHRRKKKGE